MRIVIDISEHDKEWIGNAYGIPQDINTKIAEAIINAEPCQPDPHWIPCSDELPKEDGFYLVTLEYKYGAETTVRFFKIENGESYWSVWGNENITAWMPLPEPYKGVTDGRD